MARKLKERPAPTGLKRWFLRAPIKLFDWGLGPLLGERFLLLEHVGAKTGLPRRTALEVVKHELDTGRYYVAVGFGPKSHWFKNISKTPEVTIQVRKRRMPMRARVLDDDAAGELMVDYARRNPKAAAMLMKYCGYEVDGSDDDYRDVARVGLHFVALDPR